MRTRIPCIAVGVAAAVVAVGSGRAAEPLSLEELYSLPRIIGTAPSEPVFSPDGDRLAFLWNAEGREFRDVWVTPVAEPDLRRLTSFARPSAPAASTPEAILERERAEQHRGVSEALWFPDGESLLVTFEGAFYRVAPGGDPVRIGNAGRGAAFSPGGDRIAWIEGGEVVVAPVGNADFGAGSAVTGFTAGGTGAARLVWSPGGDRLAVIERDMRDVPRRLIPDYLTDETSVREVTRPFPGEEPGRTRLWVVDLEGGGTRRMDLGDDERDLLFTVEWSPDGGRILVDKSDLYVEDRRLLALDPDSGESTLLYREQEPDNVMAFWQAAWAYDGEGVWFLSDRDDFYHLYFLSDAGQEPHAMTRGDWAVERFHVTDEAIFVVGNREHPSRRDLYRIPPTGGEPVRVSERPGSHAPTFSPDGAVAAVLFSSDTTPPDLFLNRLDGPGETRVTHSPLPAFEQHDWIAPEYVTFASHVDGATIHGRLLLPPGHDPSRRYPAIIGSVYSNSLRNQWGGRDAHPLWGLDQYLLQQGYVLLNVNIRGSWGLGREFRRRMQRDYGGIDVEDIYSSVLYLEARGDVDMERVGLWGSSYGGLMTAMSLFKRPGVFAAGVAGAPATNVRHAMTGEMRVMDRPRDFPEAYDAASPLSWVENLEDPLMIVHGMRDFIVLFGDSLVLLEHAMRHGKAHHIELVAMPNAPHGWDTVELYQTRFAFRKMADFFARHLQPEGASQGSMSGR